SIPFHGRIPVTPVDVQELTVLDEEERFANQTRNRVVVPVIALRERRRVQRIFARVVKEEPRFALLVVDGINASPAKFEMASGHSGLTGDAIPLLFEFGYRLGNERVPATHVHGPTFGIEHRVAGAGGEVIGEVCRFFRKQPGLEIRRASLDDEEPGQHEGQRNNGEGAAEATVYAASRWGLRVRGQGRNTRILHGEGVYESGGGGTSRGSRKKVAGSGPAVYCRFPSS